MLDFYNCLKYGYLDEMDEIRGHPTCTDIKDLMPYDDDKFMRELSEKKFAKLLIWQFYHNGMTDMNGVFDTIATKLKFEIKMPEFVDIVTYSIHTNYPFMFNWLGKMEKYVIGEISHQDEFTRTDRVDILMANGGRSLVKYLPEKIYIDDLINKSDQYIIDMSKMKRIVGQQFNAVSITRYKEICKLVNVESSSIHFEVYVKHASIEKLKTMKPETRTCNCIEFYDRKIHGYAKEFLMINPEEFKN